MFIDQLIKVIAPHITISGAPSPRMSIEVAQEDDRALCRAILKKIGPLFHRYFNVGGSIYSHDLN